MDPYLQGIKYQHTVRSFTGLTGATQIGYVGKRKKVQDGTVSGVLTIVTKNITMVQKEDPTKLDGWDSCLLRLIDRLVSAKHRA